MSLRCVSLPPATQGSFVARVLAWRQRWCVFRLVLIAGTAVLEAVAVAPFALEATSTESKLVLNVVMDMLLALIKAALAFSNAVWLRRKRIRLLELRGGGNSFWRTQFIFDKDVWTRSTFPMPILCTLLALFYLMSVHTVIPQCGSASVIGADSWVRCPLIGICSVMFVLNALQTLESLVDLRISSALGYEDVFPGVGGFLQLLVRVVRHDPQNNACGAEQLCAICLEEFVEGESLGQMECHHQFHEECLRRWLRAGGSCPFRCSTTTAA